MKQDDFLKQVTSKLDALAQHHKDKPVVMNQVIETIQDRAASRYGLWKMSGFALAAAITGFVVFPNSIDMAENRKIKWLLLQNFHHKWLKIWKC